MSGRRPKLPPAGRQAEVARLIGEAVRHHRENRYDRAEALYRHILRLDPRHPDALHLSGLIRHARGDQAAAATAIEAAIEAQPDRAAYHNSLGVVRLEQSDLDAAIVCFRAALDRDPLYPEALNNLGNAYLRRGDLAGAIEAYDQARAVRGDYAEAAGNRGRALHLAGRHAEAIAGFRQALASKPNAPRILRYLGEALAETGARAEAETAFRDALALAADDAESQAALAALLEKQGRLAEAAAAATAVLATRPQHMRAAATAARCARRSGRAADGLAHLDALPENAGTLEERSYAAFERGMILDKLGRYGEAHAAFAAGNRLMGETAKARLIDRDLFPWLIDQLRRCFTPEWLATWTPTPPLPESAAAPIFLIGFPRSGTTLLDQILNSHPALTTLEEKDALDVVRRRLGDFAGGYPEAMASLAADDIAALRRLYFGEVARHLGGPPAGRLVDKMPLNTIEVGLIHRLFPGAKILLALRHPCDVVLSGFMQAFEPNAAMILFDSLRSTARFYAQVMTLWKHYREVLPLDVLAIRYEDLTADFQGVTRRILDFLGLPWDEAVLDYADHAKGRAIATPSYHQVVQPIYRGSVNRWLSYRDAFADALPPLAPFIAEFGYDVGQPDNAPIAASPAAPEPASRRDVTALTPPKA